MKIHTTRINKMFLTSMLILSLGYTGELTFTTNVEVENLTIGTGDKIILADGKTLTVGGDIVISGELELLGASIVDVDGDVSLTSGKLDMNGSSRLKMTGDLTFNSATLEASAGTGINLDGTDAQSILEAGNELVGNIVSLVCSGNETIFNIDATISDSLDAGGEDFTISDGKTLTMASGSDVVISGGNWDRTGTLALHADSKVLYTTNTQSTMSSQNYGDIEHNGGTLSQSGDLVLLGTFTNTLANFVATHAITAKGIIWTAGVLEGTPTQNWDIGTDGVTINGGTFKATSNPGAFTVEGDWTNNGGTFTNNTSTVDFDGATEQRITSGGHDFYSVSISNTNNQVKNADDFEFSNGATLLIDAGAIFATEGFDFISNGGTIDNSNGGTFQMHGDENTTADQRITGDVKVMDPSGCTLSQTLGGFENVTFDSNGNTITLGESMAIGYVTGDITVAPLTTFDMVNKDLTIADGKTVTNGGTWTPPSSPSTFTCAGTATLVGDMNFFAFTAASTDIDTISFEGAKTYTVLNNLTLTGTVGKELFLTSGNGIAFSEIDQVPGQSQNVDYVRVKRVNGTGDQVITATNSWDVNGTGDVQHWNFGAMLYTFIATGDWDLASNWFQNTLPAPTDNIIVSNNKVLTLNGSRTINNVQITSPGGEIIVATDDFTVNGDCDVDGTITISSGTVDVEGAFDADGGAVTFTDAGDLELAGVVTSLGTLTAVANGTVTYDGAGAQNVVGPDIYVNLKIGGGAGTTKSLQGAVTVAGALTIEDQVTLAMGAHTLGVTGASTITGTLDVAGSTVTLTGASVVTGAITASTGIVDANGSFTADGGAVTFTDAGHLKLSGVVASLGTLTAVANGTVTYDADGAQTIVLDDYVNLIVGGAADQTKSLAGTVTVAGAFTTNASVTTAMGANNLTVEGATVINGTVTISTGILDANGTFNAEGADDLTGGFVTFTDAGHLKLSGVVASLGTLTAATNGTVTYDADGAQAIVLDNYVNLIIGGAADQTKTLAGAVIVSGAFTTNASVTTAMGANNLTVAGATVINGTVTISTGTLDANGSFNAAGAGNPTGGFVTFTDNGDLKIFGVVTSLGTLTATVGTVTYDGTDQVIFPDNYYDLTVSVAGGTTEKDLGGAVAINNDLTINTGVTLDVTGSDYAVSVKRMFTNSATFNARDGTVTFNGDVDQTLVSGASAFNNIIFANTGPATKVLAIAGNLVMDGDLTITSGTFDISSNPDVTLGGNLSIANLAKWTMGNGTLTFNSAGSQTFEDLNGTPNNLGHISID